MPMNSTPDSKFSFVVLAARRARQLQSGARPLIDLPRSHKFTRIAMEELQRGLLEYELPEALLPPQQREEKKKK